MATSPLPPKQLDFGQAMAAVTLGKKITKVSWNSLEEYGLLQDGHLRLHKDDKFHNWIVTEGDLTGIDYIIIN